MIITDSPSVTFRRDSSIAIADVSANWVEIGDCNKQKDLYNVGLLEEKG